MRIRERERGFEGEVQRGRERQRDIVRGLEGRGDRSGAETIK